MDSIKTTWYYSYDIFYNVTETHKIKVMILNKDSVFLYLGVEYILSLKSYNFFTMHWPKLFIEGICDARIIVNDLVVSL